MKSGHVVDSESRMWQLDQFFAQQTREKQKNAQFSAMKSTTDVLADAQREPGRILSHVQLNQALGKLNASLIFERSKAFPDQMGIYISSPGANSDDLDENCRNRQFVTGMAWGMVPENTAIIAQPDKHGVAHPRVKVKGWRDTLKVLIQMRLVTLDGVERAFGSGGKNWHKVLH